MYNKYVANTLLSVQSRYKNIELLCDVCSHWNVAKLMLYHILGIPCLSPDSIVDQEVPCSLNCNTKSEII